ncbi:Fumitremorgin C monooxygenase [Madurella mycetomatis]|uniref:Fumitremorgin C monooxygenase n=1 Tax=Madurella mycetomatis TaxID=100816 RepID=A0A175VY84_9PEZI|nr:Fumitremorgin C monooxygenase [Madurella mycetomatis]KXX76139.1 Fumitremorgin C monooxygenase [Madurella mycetomatis]
MEKLCSIMRESAFVDSFMTVGMGRAVAVQDSAERAAKASATTSNDFCALGHAHKASTGRFFAVTEYKLIRAHFVPKYDIKSQKATRATHVMV